MTSMVSPPIFILCFEKKKRQTVCLRKIICASGGVTSEPFKNSVIILLALGYVAK